MSQITPGQARVVDPVLTNVARGYKNAQFVGMHLFPYVPVGQRGGKVVVFGKEAFRLYNTGRAPGADIAEVQFGYSDAEYSLRQHALSGKVPVELQEEAREVPGIDMGSVAVQQVQDIIGLELEHGQASLACDPDNYGDDNKAAPAGADKWSHEDSDPVKAVAYGATVIRGKIGFRPNLLLLGANVFSSLQVHPLIVDRLKFTGRDVANEELLAQLFNVRKVVVGDAVYATGDAFADVWGNNAVLAYTDVSTLADRGRPSYGYTYRLRNHPLVEEPWYNKTNRSWMYPVFDEICPVIAGADAGFLFEDAV